MEDSRVLTACKSLMDRTWFIILVPTITYGIHAALFTDWIIDDAGISFAYARNLASGYGLVSQPGVPPVEGFSNFLWVLLIAPLWKLGVFDPVIVPKILGAIFVIGAYYIFSIAVKTFFRSPLTVMVVLTLVSVNTSFVVWTTSGLENSLNVFLLCFLMLLVFKVIRLEGWVPLAGAMGLVMTALALTRPDSVLYLVVFPAGLLLTQKIDKNTTQMMSVYLLVFTVTFGGFLLFRHWYFGEWVPNTYFAKRGPGLKELYAIITLSPLTLGKLTNLFKTVAGGWCGMVLIGTVVFTTIAVIKGFTKPQSIISLFLGISIGVFLMLPNDWMAEFRFATPFVLFFYAHMALLAERLVPMWLENRKSKVVSTVLVLILALTVCNTYGRSRQFADNPPLSLQYVTVHDAEKFNKLAARYHLKEASLLAPDVGGSLLYSNLRIYDLCGLCDKALGRIVGGADTQQFFLYIKKTRPTFIRLHDPFITGSHLHGSQILAENYILLSRKKDRVCGISEHYIRKDALK